MCLFDSIGMKCLKRTLPVIELLNKLDAYVTKNDLVLATATQRNGIYSTSMKNLRKHDFKPCSNRQCLTGSAAFYATAEFPNLKQLVKFFHETWRHADVDTMCSIVKHASFDNIPKQLTEKAIRKHFPQCENCPFGNMARKPLMVKGSPHKAEVFSIGQAWEIDIKGKWTDPDGKVQQTFCRAEYLFSAIDVNSGKKFLMLLKNRQRLIRVIQALINFAAKQNRVIKVLFSDDEFMQNELKDLYDTHSIEIRPCPPHEHDVGIGRVERWNRTLGNNVLKDFYGKEETLGSNH